LIFGIRLKKLRKENGLTQKQLADLLKVGRPTIAGYETKGKQPDFEKIKWLCNYFNVSSDYLLGLSDKKINILDYDYIGEGLDSKNIEELRKFAELLKIKQSTEGGKKTNENTK
jgi:transcriptional regulator with XRE-family HTH domain